MVDLAAVNARLARAQQDEHDRRIRALHEAQKAGLTGSSLFVAVRRDFPPELPGRTREFIEENKMP